MADWAVDFIPFDLEDPIEIQPDSFYYLYLVRNEPPTNRDSSNLLIGSWRHILYDAEGSFTNVADSFLTANTYKTGGRWPHTPQIVQSGFSTVEGEAMFLSFQARGNVDSLVVDINTGPTGEIAWAKHYVDTLALTTNWDWYYAAFTAKLDDSDNRLDFNLGLQAGEVQLKDITLSLKPPILPNPEPIDPIQNPPFPVTDTVFISRIDTVELLRIDTVQVIVRDTTIIKESLYFIQEIDGVETKRKQVWNR